jgi:hypothetical protein
MKFDFHLLKHPHLWHPWCLFWCLLLLSKRLGLPNVFPSNIPQCIYYHTSQQHFAQKFIKYKILLTQVLVMSPMYFLMSLVSSNIVYRALNILLIVPSCLKETFILEFSFCCCSPSFIIVGVVWMHFCCWPNLGHAHINQLWLSLSLEF